MKKKLNEAPASLAKPECLPGTTSTALDLRRYYQLIRRRRWLILAVATTITAGILLESLSTTPLFRASARIQLDPELPKVLPYEGVTEESVSYYDDFFLQTKFQALKSRTLARRVIRRLDLAQNPVFNHSPSSGFFPDTLSPLNWVANFISWITSAPAEDIRAAEDPDGHLVDRLLGGLDIQLMKNSWIIEVSYVSHDPAFAAQVVNVVTDEAIEESFERKYKAAMKAAEFLQRELQELKIKLEESEKALVGYGRKHNILNLSGRENIVLQNLANLNEEMTRLQSQLTSEAAEYESIKNATVHSFPPSLKNETIAGLENRLFALEQSLATLSGQFGPEWPDLLQLQREIAEVSAQLMRERQGAIENARRKYIVALDHQRRLEDSLTTQKHLANRLREESIQYNILQREVETNEQLYEGLLQRLKQAGVSAGLRSSNLQIIDQAEPPRSPFSPRTHLNLLFGLAVGILGGIGLAFLADSLDNTIKSAEAVESEIGIPNLGVIPAIQKLVNRADHRLLFDKKGRFKTAPILLYQSLQSQTPIWEAYRSFRTSILLSHPDKKPQKILVTSALIGEGKTTTVINTGVAMAQTGARTLLVDLDMRRPSLARNFGIEADSGISSFLSCNSDLSSQIRESGFPNLYLLPAGIVPPNPAELLGSGRMRNALSLLQDYFDYIFFDSPPVLSVTDPLVISPHMDGVILVIQGGTTNREAVKKAGDNLMAVGANILGALINNLDLPMSEYGYDYSNYYQQAYENPKAKSKVQQL